MRFAHICHARRSSKRHPTLEALEGRQLMSLGAEFIGPSTRRPATTSSTPTTPPRPVAPRSSSGPTPTASTDHDIRAQRFNSFGDKVGPEIVVSFSSLDEDQPSVAIDGQGRLRGGLDPVPARRRLQRRGPAVRLQRQRRGGRHPGRGGDVRRRPTPTWPWTRPGDFVVSYTRNTNNNNPDIFAKQYNSSGQLLNVINVATSSVAETHSSVAMTPDGRFDVAWEQAYSPTDHDIYLNRYSACGRPARDEYDRLQHRLSTRRRASRWTTPATRWWRGNRTATSRRCGSAPPACRGSRSTSPAPRTWSTGRRSRCRRTAAASW